MSQLKIKTINLNKTTIECHKEALPAYMIAKGYKYQYENLKLSRKTVQQLQSLDPVHAIEESRSTYYFFSGWFWLSHCHHFDCEKVAVIVHPEMEQGNIQQAAWIYLLLNQFKSFHRRNNLAQVKHYINSIPGHIRKDLLGSLKTGSSNVMVQLLSNETRSAIRNQEKLLVSSSQSPNRLSILEQLTGDDKNVS